MNNNNNNNTINKYIPIINLIQLENDIKNQFKINFNENDKNTSITTTLNDNQIINMEEWDQFNFKFKRVVLFIRRVCELLSLSSTTYFHATILFKRFIIKESLKKYNFYLVAMSCILICIKVNPSSMIAMKVRDILNISYYTLTNEKLLINDDYYNFKDNVISMEKKLLICLEFNISISVNNDNSVKLPHSYLFHFLLFLDFEKDHLVSQISLNFLNDSLLILFIQSPYFKPEEIALYSIFLSLEYTKIDLKIDKLQLYNLLGFISTTTTNTNNNYQFKDVENKYEIFKNYLNNLYSEIKFNDDHHLKNENNNSYNNLNSIYKLDCEIIKDFFLK